MTAAKWVMWLLVKCCEYFHSVRLGRDFVMKQKSTAMDDEPIEKHFKIQVTSDGQYLLAVTLFI